MLKRKRKPLRCYFGFHKWTNKIVKHEQYVINMIIYTDCKTCVHCGKVIPCS